MPIHLIFEGAELTGKSYLMSLVYQFLDKKDATSENVLDGCYWINSDIGIFGTEYGRPIIDNYLQMARTLKNKNLLFEKLHITDAVYQRLYNNITPDYTDLENKLQTLDFKIVFVTMRDDLKLVEKRLADRLKLYPHYGRIAKGQDFYLKQQELYRREMNKSQLPHLEVDMTDLNDRTEEIISWAQNHD